MGGSTMKTAKVWKYFIQLPSEEQAAECRICCKRIKATNSSTTGMIRHLRSCHSSEYQILQAARQNSTAKQESETMNMRPNNPTKISKNMTGHSITNIIATTFDIRRKHLENNIRFMYVGNSPEQKKTKFDECCTAVGLQLEPGIRTDHKQQTDRARIVRGNIWPDDHPDAQKISDQIGIMLLLDNESPAIISRAGFRNLIRFLQPKYQLPSTEQFHKVIIPRLIGQLRFGALSLQQTGGIGSQQNDLDAPLSSLTAILLAKGCDADDSISSGNNHGLAALSTVCSEQKELERVVINSIRSAQNISQSFSHSIQLCDEDTDSSVNFEKTLSARINSFMKRIGECVFPQAELTDLVTRCYYACRHLEKLADNAQHQPRLNIQSPLGSSDLADCVEYVHKNLDRIHDEHKRYPIPMFKPFTLDETQFLSDLNMHIHSMYLRS